MTRPTPDPIARLADALGTLPAGVTGDARLHRSSWRTMRFANSWIHQPHVESGATVSLRVVADGRIATATTTDLSDAGIGSLAATALALARVAPREPKFPGFPEPDGTIAPVAVSAATRRLSVDAAARLAASAIEAARAEVPDARVSGAVHVGAESITVLNSSGLRRSTERTAAEASVLVERLDTDPPVSGWAEGSEWDATRLDPRRLGRVAARRVPTAPVRSIRPGRYPVVLRVPAAAELVGFLGHLGFNGHGELEGWSCLAKRRGRRIVPPSFELTDDGRSPLSLPQAIDYEGAAKRRTPLIEDGRAAGPALDLVTAGRLGATTTGHGMPPESPWGEYGPSPCQMIVGAGDATEAEMIRSMRRGLVVTRFHYVRIVHPSRSIITGMTRDGTYLVEDGEIVAPVRNLRFTQSVLGALAGIEQIGRARERVGDERGFAAVTTPALLTRDFRFTSATVF